MIRREFIAGLGGAGAYVAVPRIARAQQGMRVRRLAILMQVVNSPGLTAVLDTLRDDLAKLGWVEGRNLQIDLRFAERLELLRKFVPAAGSIAAFVGGADRQFTQNETRELQSAGHVLGTRLLILNVPTSSDIAAAFLAIIEQQAGALLLSANIVFQRARDQIISLATRYGIPTMFWDSTSTAAGALSSYGPDFAGAFHQAGLYAGRILKGEKPADLPVVQPTKFEFVINMKTANALGLTIPPTLLALADQVIE